MRRPSAVVAVVVTSILTLLAGCSSDEPRHPTLRLSWQEVTLPAPPGPPGRIAVRDATSCAGTWYVVGASLTPDGGSRPAVWSSNDARTWHSLSTDPTAYYARRAILTSVACSDGQIATIGAKSGGAHGLPRTTSWYQREDGTLVDVPATFELYGGPNAVSVDRLAGGPEGWLIAGNRTGGAAVWFSGDATDFRLVDSDPALSSDPGHATTATDAVHDGSAWTVVGRATLPGHAIAPVPLAWTSADGLHWQRQQVPAGTTGFADLERVIRVGDDVLAAGIRGHRFGIWRRTAGHWSVARPFGALDRNSTGAPFVSGLATVSGHLLATVSDGARFRLWAQPGASWLEVAIPVRPTTAGDHQLTVAASGAQVLLLADDGTSGRVWLGHLS